MVAKIYIENLPREYREKLCSRKLTKAAIDSLARSVSERYFRKKRALKRAAVICAASTLLLLVLTALSPVAEQANRNAIIFSFVYLAVLEAAILTAVYYIAVARVPRQFAECLQAGYPELVMYYGYEVIKSGSLHGSVADQKGTEL